MQQAWLHICTCGTGSFNDAVWTHAQSARRCHGRTRLMAAVVFSVVETIAALNNHLKVNR